MWWDAQSSIISIIIIIFVLVYSGCCKVVRRFWWVSLTSILSGVFALLLFSMSPTIPLKNTEEGVRGRWDEIWGLLFRSNRDTFIPVRPVSSLPCSPAVKEKTVSGFLLRTMATCLFWPTTAHSQSKEPIRRQSQCTQLAGSAEKRGRPSYRYRFTAVWLRMCQVILEPSLHVQDTPNLSKTSVTKESSFHLTVHNETNDSLNDC